MIGNITTFCGKGLALSRWSSFLRLASFITLVMSTFLITGCSRERPKLPEIPLDSTLKIGVIPTRGVLPLYVAEIQNYFAEEGLSVELVPFQSFAEKDAAFQAGAIDGMFSDLVAATLLRSQGEDLSVIALVSGGGSDEGRVAIVAAPQSNLHSSEDLPGHDVAISPNTIIDFVTDQLLREEGINVDTVRKIPISKIHLRLNMLLEGKVSAAVLPEPLVTYAQTRGGRVILDDQHDGRCFLVLAMRGSIATQRMAAVEGFLIAYNRAVSDINVSPSLYRSALINVAKVPQVIEDVIRVTRYSQWRVPSRAQVEGVVEWLQMKHLVKRPLRYRALVDDRFVLMEDQRCMEVWREQQLARSSEESYRRTGKLSEAL